MSKITIPLLMIFAAVGFFALAKLDRDEHQERSHQWPAKLSPPAMPVKADEITPEEVLPALPERLSSEEFERNTNRKLANIRLLPSAEDLSPVSFLWPSDDGDRAAHPELLKIARRNSFDAWKSYTDEHVAFFYPDAPGIRVELVDGVDPLKIISPEMLPPDAGSFKRYRITAGDAGTLCLISLARANRFDDAPREPQPEVFYRFTESGGGLMRTAFTELGQVRRVELLGEGIRASLLDWPHLAIHQDLYLRIAASIQLAPPYATLSRLREAAILDYGLQGRLGWLEHGAPESEVIDLLGQPAAHDPEFETLDYICTRGDEHIFYKVPIHQGLFVGFGDDWRTVSHSAPDEGSIRWMYEKTDFRAGPPGAAGYDLGPLSDEEAQAIFDRIVEIAPAADAADWTQLAHTIVNLSQHGLRDQRLVEIARARLEDPGADPRPALLALEACDSELSKAAIAQHIITQFASTSLDPETLDDIYTLIAYLGQDFPGTPQLIDRALGDQSDQVRELGFKFCSWLPEKFALPHLEAGLQDASTDVRRRCASAFASDHGDPERHPEMLEICLSEEQDEEVKILLEDAIQRLRGDRQGS